LYLRLPYQALVEFVSAPTRPGKTGPLLERADALREVEELLSTFEILYPTEGLLRLAVRGTSAYQLNWFDANLWAYAEFFGIGTLLSEDFQHNRLYGSVQVVNPFLEA
jgi:predicted nucleic acid-binding protein